MLLNVEPSIQSQHWHILKTISLSVHNEQKELFVFLNYVPSVLAKSSHISIIKTNRTELLHICSWKSMKEYFQTRSQLSARGSNWRDRKGEQSHAVDRLASLSWTKLANHCRKVCSGLHKAQGSKTIRKNYHKKENSQILGESKYRQ